MNVLITGGAGFIGSHIAKKQIRLGHSVWVLDQESTDRIKGLPLRFDRSEVQKFRELDAAVHWADRIYHMAATLGQKRILADPLGALSNNIHSLEVILRSMIQQKKKAPLVVASSSAVYWHGVEGENLREDSILKIPSQRARQEVYGLSKLINETMSLSSELPICIARLFNIIGPDQREDFIVPSLINQALKNQPMQLTGDGTQRRSFCHVEDAIQAMDLLLDLPRSKGEIFNIGGGPFTSLNELASLIKDLGRSHSKIIHVPHSQVYESGFQEAVNLEPSFEKLTQATGFTPTWSLKKTIESVLREKKQS